MRSYIEATKFADADRAPALFHKSALMSGDFGSGAQSGSPEGFFNSLKGASKRPADTGCDAHYRSVSMLGNTVTGEVVEKNLFGYDFTSRFHLLKIDGHWLIVRKLYFGSKAAVR